MRKVSAIKKRKRAGKWVHMKLDLDMPVEIRAALSELLQRLRKEPDGYMASLTNRDLIVMMIHRRLDDEGLLPPGFRVPERFQAKRGKPAELVAIK